MIDLAEYTFDFGKYETWQYHDVKAKDPFYIQWCAESIGWFVLPSEELMKINTLCAKGTRRSQPNKSQK